MLYNDDNLKQMTKKVQDLFIAYTDWNECHNIDMLYSDDLYNDIDKYTGESFDDVEFKATFLPQTQKHNSIICCTYNPTFLDNQMIDSTLLIYILHELTHAYDYTLFCQEFCNNDFSQLKQHSLYRGFYYWSEHHARRTSLKITIIDQMLQQHAHYPSIAEKYYTLAIQDIEKILASNKELDLYDIIAFLSKENLYDEIQLLMRDKHLVSKHFDFKNDRAIRQIQLLLNRMPNFQSAKWLLDNLTTYVETFHTNPNPF